MESEVCVLIKAVHHEWSQAVESQDQLKLQLQQYAQQVMEYQTALDRKVS